MIKHIVFILFAIVFIISRALFAVEKYTEFMHDRDNDIKLFETICIEQDILSSLGKHSYLCDEIKTRLSSHVLFHTINHVTNDILHRDFSVPQIIQYTCMLIVLYVADIAVSVVFRSYSKYSQEELPMRMPMRMSLNQKSIKYD